MLYKFPSSCVSICILFVAVGVLLPVTAQAELSEETYELIGKLRAHSGLTAEDYFKKAQRCHRGQDGTVGLF